MVGRRQVLAEAVVERGVRGLGVAFRAGEEDQGAAFAPSAQADDVPVIVGVGGLRRLQVAGQGNG